MPLTLSAIIIFLIIYLFFLKFLQKRLLENSRLIEKNSKRQVQIMQESIGSFRDILMGSNQNYFLNIYKKVDQKLKAKNAENIFFNLFPRYAIESLFLVILSFLVLVISFQGARFVNIIAILGTFAIGAQKLLPCMQQSYGTWSYIVGSKAILKNIIELTQDKKNFSISNYILLNLNLIIKLYLKILCLNIQIQYKMCLKI